jgi:hypothetical protein
VVIIRKKKGLIYLRILPLVFVLYLSLPISLVFSESGNATSQPKIISYSTKPYSIIGHSLYVPKGPGELIISVQAENTNKVEFLKIPTGTATYDERVLIGEDTDGKDGWSITWKYGDEILHDHIEIQAYGLGGKSVTSFNIYTEQY